MVSGLPVAAQLSTQPLYLLLCLLTRYLGGGAPCLRLLARRIQFVVEEYQVAGGAQHAQAATLHPQFYPAEHGAA